MAYWTNRYRENLKLSRPISDTTEKPNILLVMTDQHAARALGAAGDPAAQTPALDALAARGTRFSNAYCPAPLCVPSRMAFLTGLEPHLPHPHPIILEQQPARDVAEGPVAELTVVGHAPIVAAERPFVHTGPPTARLGSWNTRSS